MRRHHVAVAVLAAVYLVYLGAVVWRGSTVFGGERYFSLGDDAMISMRYARNFAAGHGLVWNAGEPPVEGYTNLLWVLMMTLVHAFPLPTSKTSLPVEALNVSLLLANLFVIRRVAADLGAGPAASAGAALLTALYYPLTAWSMSGAELALLVPALGVAVVAALRGLSAGRFSSAPYWILGAAMLVRFDVAAVYVGLLAAMTIADPENRARHLKYGIGVLALFAGAQTVFRLSYYGEWLPNTYYLKMTGYPILWRVAWGVRGLAGFVWHHLLLVLTLAAIGTYQTRSRGMIVATVVAAQFAYAAYIGPSDNRFTTLVVPLVFALAAVGAETMAHAISCRVAARGRAVWLPAILATAAVWTFSPEMFVFRALPASVLERVKTVDELTTANARVAVARAGTIPYFLDRPAIDLLGKNDYRLARAAVHPSFRSFGDGFVAGHMKWDYAYSIGTLAPDVVADLWRYPDEAAPYLKDYQPLLVGDDILYLRRASPRIHWDRLPSAQASGAQP
jgi:hypothetical protein